MRDMFVLPTMFEELWTGGIHQISVRVNNFKRNDILNIHEYSTIKHNKPVVTDWRIVAAVVGWRVDKRDIIVVRPILYIAGFEAKPRTEVHHGGR